MCLLEMQVLDNTTERDSNFIDVLKVETNRVTIDRQLCGIRHSPYPEVQLPLHL